jgi:hypothetical protein
MTSLEDVSVTLISNNIMSDKDAHVTKLMFRKDLFSHIKTTQAKEASD